MKHGVAYHISPSDCQEFNEALESFENISSAIVGWTAMGEVIYANRSACDLLGCPRIELEGLQIRMITPGLTAEDWSSFWPGLDREDSQPAGRTRQLSGKKKLSVEFRALFTLPSGVKYCLVRMPGKSPATGIKLGAHGRPLELVLNSIAIPIFVLDEQHEITFLNRAACQELGTTAAKAAGTTAYDYMPKRIADLAWEHDRKALESGRPVTYAGDGFYQAKYGESATILPFLDTGTSRKRLLVIVKRAPSTAYPPSMINPGTAEPAPGRPKSEHLHEISELLERSAPLGIFLKNTDNRYLWVNQALARMAGFKPKDFIGKCVEDLLSDPEILSVWRKQDDYIYSTGKPLFNQIIPRSNNQPGFCREDKFPFINANGELAGIIGLVVEIDEPVPPAEALKEELASTSKKLSEIETALHVVIEGRQQDVSLTRDQLSAKIRDQILPYLEHLKKTHLRPEQSEFVELIETNLKNFYDPAYARLSSANYKLSPTELKVSQLIRDGKTNKEIAKLLHLSKSTILTHRHHVRAKLGIKNKKVNLRCLLIS
jgi:PAS domain-containing protein/DNA-binding CsgD family transcriptional regulator